MCRPTTSGNKPIGFLNRWHLYRDDTLMYTVIPSQEGVTLVGVPKMMRHTKEVLKLSESEYSDWLRNNNYVEV